MLRRNQPARFDGTSVLTFRRLSYRACRQRVSADVCPPPITSHRRSIRTEVATCQTPRRPPRRSRRDRRPMADPAVCSRGPARRSRISGLGWIDEGYFLTSCPTEANGRSGSPSQRASRSRCQRSVPPSSRVRQRWPPRRHTRSPTTATTCFSSSPSVAVVALPTNDIRSVTAEKRTSGLCWPLSEHSSSVPRSRCGKGSVSYCIRRPPHRSRWPTSCSGSRRCSTSCRCVNPRTR
jgi:hypothetical protein